jgi:predicted HicB family RNase H-like nuclease
VRLAGRDPELVVVLEDAPEPVSVGAGEEYTGRITLRLPETLKSAVEALADQEGVSTNAWLVRTIARSLEARPSKRAGRNRLQGYAQG